MAVKGFVIRGLFSVWLTRGPENLLALLNSIKGVELEIEDHGTWPASFGHVGSMTERARNAKLEHHKLVLIGHSFGATAAINVNNRLANMDIGVDLLCPIDPAAQYSTAITDTGQRVIGFFQREMGQLGQGYDTAGNGWTATEWKERVVQHQRHESHIAIVNDPWVWNVIRGGVAKLAEESVK
jgi:hypothetical protein